MSATFRATVVMAAAALLGGCSDFQALYDDCFARGVCLEDGDRRLGPPSATASSVEVSRSVGVTADGVDTVEITVTVRDAEGQGIPDVAVALAVTGEATLIQPAPTDTAGKTVASLRSTRAELTVVTATLSTATPLQLRDAPSVRFDAGAPARLVFQVPPGAGQAGEPLAPALRVAVTDAFGNLVTTATHPVTLSLAEAPGSAVLSGGVTVGAVGGVATFVDLEVNRPGSYQLGASALGLEGMVSDAFEVRVGRPSSLRFLTQPAGAVAGAALPAVTVALLDSAGNTVTTAEESVSLTLLGAATGTLEGAVVAAPVSGVATFEGLSIRQAAQGYVLAASAGGGYAGVLSDPFAVAPGAVSATKSGIVAAPSSVPADGVAQVELAVRVVDELYNTVPNATVTLAASGSANVLLQPQEPTGANGIAAARLRSIAIGPQTISAQATVGAAVTTLVETAAVSFTVPPPELRLEPPSTAGGCVVLEYAVRQTQGLPVDVVLEYDADGSGNFQRLTQAGSTQHHGVSGVGSSPALGGRAHSFLWNSTADLPRLLSPNVTLRAHAVARGVAGPYELLRGLAVDNGIALAPTRVSLAAGAYSSVAVSADFNRDGLDDVAMFGSYAGGRGISLMYGNGQAALQPGPGIVIPGASGELSATVDDFNHDGRPDVLFTKGGTGTVYVAFGGGVNDLQTPVGVPFSGSTTTAASGDYDRDGHPDILVASAAGLKFLKGNGAGGFAAEVHSPIGAGGDKLVTRDFNRDGILDAVTTHWDNPAQTGRVELRLGTGTGTFASPPAASTTLYSLQPLAMEAGDMDRDGRDDLVLVVSGAQVAILLSQGASGFAVPQVYSTVSDSGQLKLADFNSDGALDVVVSRASYNAITVLAGKGDGTLHAPQPYIAGYFAHTLAIGDTTGDGRPDIVLGHGYVRDITLFENRTAAPCEGGWRAPTLLPLPGFPSLPARPTTVAVGDFNQDGKPDMAATDPNLKLLHVLSGAGNGDFHSVQQYGTGGTPLGLRTLDLDDDGKLELVSANDDVFSYVPNAHGSLTVLKGLADGTFRFWDELALVGRAQHVALGDVDGDGRMDLVAPTWRNTAPETSMALLNGMPDNTFLGGDYAPLLPTSPPLGAELADLDGDGRLDFVSASAASGVAAITRFGDAPLTWSSANIDALCTGELVPSTPGEEIVTVHRDGTAGVLTLTPSGLQEHARGTLFAAGPAVETVGTADFDGDGALDVVATGSGQSSVAVASLLAGTFSAPSRSVVAEGISSLRPADVNGDGKADVVFSSPYGSSIGAALGNGNRTFGSTLTVDLTGGSPTGLAAADFDGDGLLDLVATTSSAIRVLTTGDRLVSRPAISVTTDLRGVAAGDFNRDGRADVVVLEGGTSLLRFYAGNGAGGLVAGGTVSVVAPPAGELTELHPADFDLDGKLDLFVTSNTGTTLLFGVGNGTFTAGVSPLSSARDSMVLDVNQDGKPDLVGTIGVNLNIALGNGTRTFPAPDAYYVGWYYFTGGDQAGNGATRFVVRRQTELVTYQWSTGGLTQVANVPASGQAESVHLLESNGDGYLDVLTAGESQGVLTLHQTSGEDAFVTTRRYASARAQLVVVQDFNRDGRMDFAVASDGATVKSVTLLEGF